MKKDPTSNDGQLGNLFKHYQQKFKPPQKTVISEFIIVVKEMVGTEVIPNQVSYTPGTRIIHIKTASVIRSEILRHKTAIKKTLKERLGEGFCPVDIL